LAKNTAGWSSRKIVQQDNRDVLKRDSKNMINSRVFHHCPLSGGPSCYTWSALERRRGSTYRAPGHSFFAWRCSWRMVVYIFHTTAARSWAAPVRATGTVRKRQAVRPVHHMKNHTCQVTLLQPARQYAVLGQPSIAFGLFGALCRVGGPGALYMGT
jgi:hypothetical protein